jgi:multidrug efflux pump subunit AcrB
MLFWPGVMGSFFFYLPFCVIVVLTSSLFVALVFNPVMAAAFMRASKYGEGGLMQKWSRYGHFFLDAYERTLRGALRFPTISMFAGLGVLIATFMVYGAFARGVEFFPEVEPESASVNIRLPEGASLEQTDAITRIVEGRIPANPDIKGITTTVGGAGASADPFAAEADATNVARITIGFKPDAERQGSPTKYLESLHPLVADIPGAEIEVKKQAVGPPTGAKVNIEVSVVNEADLPLAVRRVRDICAQVPGVTDLTDDYRVG